MPQQEGLEGVNAGKKTLIGRMQSEEASGNLSGLWVARKPRWIELSYEVKIKPWKLTLETLGCLLTIWMTLRSLGWWRSVAFRQKEMLRVQESSLKRCGE